MENINYLTKTTLFDKVHIIGVPAIGGLFMGIYFSVLLGVILAFSGFLIGLKLVFNNQKVKEVNLLKTYPLEEDRSVEISNIISPNYDNDSISIKTTRLRNTKRWPNRRLIIENRRRRRNYYKGIYHIRAGLDKRNMQINPLAGNFKSGAAVYRNHPSRKNNEVVIFSRSSRVKIVDTDIRKFETNTEKLIK